MDVEVHHGLAGGFADVDADVVAIGVEVLVEEGSGSPGEGEEGSVFLIGGVEEACDVAEGDEEEVAGAAIILKLFILLPVLVRYVKCLLVSSMLK